MTYAEKDNAEKDKIINELKQLIYNCFNSLKDILEKNELVYAVEHKFELGGAPFSGCMPVICDDMIEDLFLDMINQPDCVKYDLHEKTYVKNRIAEYNDFNLPKNRILRHLAEVERLKEKYNVSDEDLKK